MCLGVPGQIVSIEGESATLDVWGAQVKVQLLDIIEEPLVVGDYVVEHAGYVIRKISPDLVADTLAMYEVVLCDAGEDPVAADVAAELT